MSTMDAIITGHKHFNWSVCKPVYNDYRSSRQGDALFGLCCKTIPMSGRFPIFGSGPGTRLLYRYLESLIRQDKSFFVL